MKQRGADLLYQRRQEKIAREAAEAEAARVAQAFKRPGSLLRRKKASWLAASRKEQGAEGKDVAEAIPKPMSRNRTGLHHPPLPAGAAGVAGPRAGVRPGVGVRHGIGMGAAQLSCSDMGAGNAATEPEPSTCSICLGDMIGDEPVKTLGCKHEFHLSCINIWCVSPHSCHA